MTRRAYAAVDLGASSGRVMVGRVGPSRLELSEAHRFPNEPVRLPDGQPALVRCILDSLAAAYARTVGDAVRLSGRQVEVVPLVGGAHNRLLCQLTADACRLPVLAGPVEATTLGNVLVQARAHGSIHGDLQTLRDLLRATQEVRATSRPGRASERTRR